MPHTRFTNLSTCELCGSSSPLQRSHLLPNFLFKQLRGTAGRFFAVSLPQKPIQAGPTAKLLCYSCEQKMSRWEGEVKRAFYPDEMQAKLPIKYGRWLQMFALSISWRALTYLKHSTKNPYVSLSSSAEELLPSIPSEIYDAAEACRLEWGNALLLGQASSSQSDQHLLFLNGKNFPYERSSVVGFTVCISASIIAVVSQLGPCCVVGILRDERPLAWKNTRIQSVGGKFHVAKQTIPEDVSTWFAGYFKNIADIDAQPLLPEDA